MNFSSRYLVSLPLIAAVLALGAGAVRAQLEGSERGIPPVDSTSTFEVTGVEVDVSAENANRARMEGWRRAQADGWKMLWARTHNRPPAEAPSLSDSVLNGIVAGIVIEQEQIGPRRYVARLGVLFDRARTGQMLGVQGLARRSAPMLVIPVMQTGGFYQSFESRNPWQAAWARFRTASSPIDYVRTSGAGIDPLLLNLNQANRPGRRWWRLLLDQYGAADIVVPVVELKRSFPGGPVIGVFSARHGPDNQLLDRFELRADTSADLARMLDEGVRRLDAVYARALEQGLLRPDPSLIIEDPLPPPPPVEVEQPREAPVASSAPPPPTAGITTFSIQYDSPNPAAIQQAEIAVSRVGGVTSALTTSTAVGGTSVMRVTFSGDAAQLQAGLQAQGWQVQQIGGTTLRISR
ncbi:MAG: heavy-metal-associated domain-containing protein [Allosphingosinicella sp.]|uniref:heavy-metal-associated domain-containing protein n=1 Tax=Allosphingosinicella sp. TaxID=2823234 RepID=UPI00392D1363